MATAAEVARLQAEIEEKDAALAAEREKTAAAVQEAADAMAMATEMEQSLADRERAVSARESEAAVGKADSPVPDGTGKYIVTSAGAPYMVNGDPAYVQVAMHGYVIDLTDDEALRLLKLDAVRAATADESEADKARRARDAEIDAQNAAGPVNNPFGGRPVGTSVEAHAAEQIALARKAAA